ncbi:MAG: nicotinate phosphoribosyltransferase [Nitrososphaeria archaeon]
MLNLDRKFWIAKEDEIKNAETTDVYFSYTKKVLEKYGLHRKVIMEVYARNLPFEGNWGVLLGVHDCIKLLEGLPVNVKSMQEGEIFQVNPKSIVYEPVMQIECYYDDFCLYENPLLGLLAENTGIASKAARYRLIAGNKILFSFGSRRIHPVLAPASERAIYIAGFDGVSNMLAAKLIGVKPVGTMPHALIQVFEDQKKAWKAFDDTLPNDVPRIALIDTFYDEKAEAIMALETLGEKLAGVRLDTPRSRRGEWRKIIEEVRWELNVRGGSNVKIFVSGSIDEKIIRELSDLVDGFGIGASVSAAPPVDFSAKIVAVEVDGKMKPIAKRGDIGGAKNVFRDWETFTDYVTIKEGKPPAEKFVPLLEDVIVDGRVVIEFEDTKSIRDRVLKKIARLREVEPKIVYRI